MAKTLTRLIDILDWAHQWFSGKDIANARREAEILLAHCLDIKRIELYMYFDRPLDDKQRPQFKDLIQRRVAHEPIAYILGETDFYGRRFEVNPDTLIPRSETEELVELALSHIKEGTVLDIGTGSGIIACTLTAECPALTLHACDISAPALAMAKANAESLEVDSRVTFHELDALTSDLPFKPESLDAIVTNPPYVDEKDIAGLAPEVKDHEPHLALIGGGQIGENFIQKMLPRLYPLLKPGGWIFVEIGYNQRAIFTTFLNDTFPEANTSIKQDLSQRDRFLVIQKNG